MKSCIPAIRSLLIAHAPLLALVKTGTGQPRVYLMRAEQFTAGGDIIIGEVSGMMGFTLDQGSTDPWEMRISLECRASTYAQCILISETAKDCLLPFTGHASGLNVHGIEHASEYSDYSDEGTVFRHTVDFRVHYGP